MIARLGSTRAVVILEPDAVPADCFDAARGLVLAEAVRQLSTAGHSVYLDAGHARWKSTGETAERLLASGIADAEGFAVNVSNRQTTAASIAWGRELSDLVGHAAVRGRRVPQRDRPAAGRPGRRRPVVQPDAPGASAWRRPRTRARRASTPCSGSSDRGSPTASAAARSPTSSRPARPGELIVNSPDVPPDARHAAQLASAPPATTSPMG